MTRALTATSILNSWRNTATCTKHWIRHQLTCILVALILLSGRVTVKPTALVNIGAVACSTLTMLIWWWRHITLFDLFFALFEWRGILRIVLWRLILRASLLLRAFWRIDTWWWGGLRVHHLYQNLIGINIALRMALSRAIYVLQVFATWCTHNLIILQFHP